MSKAVTAPAKGTRDFLALDVRRREFVGRIIREVYESHGFTPLETPAFERIETLLGKYGDEGDQLVFKIMSRGQQLVDGVRQSAEHLQQPGAITVGRSGETAPGLERLLADMGLRYDLTVPLARVYAEYQGKLPAVYKRYQIQPVWRADTPGKGRFREFYQCDVDVIGSSSRMVEAEVAGAVAECLRRLKFDRFEIRINHRAFLRAMIEVAGVPLEQEGEAIVALDKLDKIGAEGVDAELEKKGLGPEARMILLGLTAPGLDLGGARALLGGHERGLAALAELEEILTLGKHTPAGARLRFDPVLARGLGYYTGAIFEIAVQDLAGSLGGGGRYDRLIGMFLGKDVPACGFSIGFERILVVMEERRMFPAELSAADVLVAAVSDAHAIRAIELAYQLRAAPSAPKVDLSPNHEKPAKLRKAADEQGARAAIWIEADGSLHAWSKHKPEQRDVPLASIEEAVAFVG
ncbi:MAG: histidine--tRNA ligase [Myxococcota bacterium]